MFWKPFCNMIFFSFPFLLFLEQLGLRKSICLETNSSLFHLTLVVRWKSVFLKKLWNRSLSRNESFFFSFLPLIEGEWLSLLTYAGCCISITILVFRLPSHFHRSPFSQIALFPGMSLPSPTYLVVSLALLFLLQLLS